MSQANRSRTEPRQRLVSFFSLKPTPVNFNPPAALQRRHLRAAATAAVVSLSIFLRPPVLRSAIVTQIEAPDSSGHYAPVNFSGKTTATSVGFPDIVFTADSGLSTADDLSPHAADVLAHIVDAAHPSVSAVHAMSSSDFLNRILRPSLTKQKPPLKLPGKPQFVNASFTGSSETDALDGQILTETDVLIARDKVFFAAGAVTDVPNVASRASLLWGASNVLAVRGTSTDATFDPEDSTAGRHYANLWSTGTASDATGDLTSYALALSQNSRFAKKAAAPALLRATLMASADRTDSTLGQWSADLPNGLDADLGAGRADFSAAQTLISSAAPVFAKPKNLTVKGPFETGPKPKTIPTVAPGSGGATSLTLPKNGQLASLFEVSSAVPSLTATLTWDIAKPGGDVRLDLVAVTLDAKGNAVLSSSLLARDAGTDNVDFLSSDSGLAPGLYAWLITNMGSTPLTPSFAFSLGDSVTATSVAAARPDALLAVPEPAMVSVFLGIAGVLLPRRTRRNT